MRTLAVILAALLAAACQTAPVVPELTTGVQVVPKPYPVPCVDSVPPLPAPPMIATDADIEQRAAWARIRDTQLRQHIAVMRAQLVACVNPGGTAP